MTKRNSNWPIIILSLPGEDTRRAPLLESLDALDLSYEVLLGVDGRQGLAPEWLAQIDRPGAQQRLGRPMTEGEFACALSHQTVYRRILSEGWAGAVVLEDDAIIGPQFGTFMQQALYLKSDIMMLYHSHARVIGRATQIMPDVQMEKLSFSCSGAVAYSLNSNAAAALVAANAPVRNIADWPSDFEGLHATVLVPQLIGHPPLAHDPSHLEGQRRSTTTKHRKRGLQKVQPLFTKSFWMRWITKRLSHRVS